MLTSPAKERARRVDRERPTRRVVGGERVRSSPPSARARLPACRPAARQRAGRRQLRLSSCDAPPRGARRPSLAASGLYPLERIAQVGRAAKSTTMAPRVRGAHDNARTCSCSADGAAIAARRPPQRRRLWVRRGLCLGYVLVQFHMDKQAGRADGGERVGLCLAAWAAAGGRPVGPRYVFPRQQPACLSREVAAATWRTLVLVNWDTSAAEAPQRVCRGWPPAAGYSNKMERALQSAGRTPGRTVRRASICRTPMPGTTSLATIAAG